MQRFGCNACLLLLLCNRPACTKWHSWNVQICAATMSVWHQTVGFYALKHEIAESAYKLCPSSVIEQLFALDVLE